MISGTQTKPASPTSVTTSPANSQTSTEPPSDLRLSWFAAHVKDPLLRSGLALAGANQGLAPSVFLGSIHSVWKMEEPGRPR
jgi:hypothetical protein